MEKYIKIILFSFLLTSVLSLFPLLFSETTFGGEWISCCESGCDYSNCESIETGETVYYCTYDGSSWGWRTSYPAEVCGDGIDNDCDGKIDCNDNDCSNDPACDTTPPTTTITPDGTTNWVNSDVSFTLSCSDASSGCQETKYSVIDSSSSCPSSYDSLSNTGTSGTVSCLVGSACQNVVCYASIDNVGNKESVKRSNVFYIDKKKPTGSVSHSPTSPTDQDQVTFTATGSDGESGLNKIEIYVDNSLTKTCTYTGETTEQSCSYIGGPYLAGSTHSYYAKFYDVAGNEYVTSSNSFTVSGINCSSDIDCDDNNPCTIDECINPGQSDSYCKYTNKRCGVACSVNSVNGVCDGKGNCYTNVGTSSCVLDCSLPSLPPGFTRNLTGSCGRPNGVHKCGDASVCDVSSCTYSNEGIEITGSYMSINYPSGYFKSGDTLTIKVNGVIASNNWAPLTECKLVKSDGTGIFFDYWGTGDVTFGYTIKDGDPEGDWYIEYCGVFTDFEKNKGWTLKLDNTEHHFTVDKTPPTTTATITDQGNNNYQITLSCSDSGSQSLQRSYYT